MEVWKYSHTCTIGCKKAKTVDYLYSDLGRLKKVYYDGRVEISTPKCKGKHGERIYVTIAKLFPEICGEYFDGCQIDHLNTDRSDNRAVNLKCCTAKENMSNPLTILHCRKPKTKKHCENMSKAKKGKPAHNQKVALMMDINSKEIFNVFSSCQEAADVTGLSHGNIPNACRGKYHGSHVYGGYYWMYLL